MKRATITGALLFGVLILLSTAPALTEGVPEQATAEDPNAAAAPADAVPGGAEQTSVALADIPGIGFPSWESSYGVGGAVVVAAEPVAFDEALGPVGVNLSAVVDRVADGALSTIPSNASGAGGGLGSVGASSGGGVALDEQLPELAAVVADAANVGGDTDEPQAEAVPAEEAVAGSTVGGGNTGGGAGGGSSSDQPSSAPANLVYAPLGSGVEPFDVAGPAGAPGLLDTPGGAGEPGPPAAVLPLLAGAPTGTETVLALGDPSILDPGTPGTGPLPSTGGVVVQAPEPASLLLFGAALAAGASRLRGGRRRA